MTAPSPVPDKTTGSRSAATMNSDRERLIDSLILELHDMTKQFRFEHDFAITCANAIDELRRLGDIEARVKKLIDQWDDDEIVEPLFGVCAKQLQRALAQPHRDRVTPVEPVEKAQ